jgi:hypothetical protein
MLRTSDSPMRSPNRRQTALYHPEVFGSSLSAIRSHTARRSSKSAAKKLGALPATPTGSAANSTSSSKITATSRRTTRHLKGRSRRWKTPWTPSQRTTATSAKFYRSAATHSRSKCSRSALPCNRASAASTSSTRASRLICNWRSTRRRGSGRKPGLKQRSNTCQRSFTSRDGPTLGTQPTRRDSMGQVT